jgi:hypothetical protein
MTNTPIITVTELASMIANGDKIVVADCRFDPFAPEAGPAAYSRGHAVGVTGVSKVVKSPPETNRA